MGDRRFDFSMFCKFQWEADQKCTPRFQRAPDWRDRLQATSMQWDGKTYKQGWRGCLAFASACVDAQLLGGNAEVTVREKLIRAGNVGEVLREMLRGDFFDTMGYRIPIENASAGDVIQIEYVMAGSRRASFGIIEPRKEMLQIFDLTGLSCTSLRDWLQTPYVFRAWRPGK